MAKGFKHGAGGGNPLNFAVVGGLEQPGNPKENMIWVNTDQKITSYIFSATQPANPTEGMVWITICTSSSAEFNALKKNGIQVYPVSAKQYISGAWVDKTASSYQGGAWKDWMIILYEPGNEHTDITGGWNNSARWFSKSGGTYTLGSYTLNSDGLTISLSGKKDVFVYAKNKIDLTDVRKIEFTVTNVYIEGADRTYLAVCTAVGNETMHNAVAQSYIAKAGTFSLDVSSLSGAFYIGFSNTVYDQTKKYTVTSVKLIP